MAKKTGSPAFPNPSDQERIAALEAELALLREREAEMLRRGVHGSASLRRPADQLETTLRGTADLYAEIWDGQPPPAFDPVATRERVVRKVLAATVDERRAWMRRISFFATPMVTALWDKLDAMRAAPCGEDANLRVIGEQGSGKTWATREYAFRANRGAPRGTLPVLWVHAPAGGLGLADTFRGGLALMGWPTLGPNQDVEYRFYTAAIEHGVELIVIDEGGMINTPGKRDHLRKVTDVLMRPIAVVSAEPGWYGNDAHLGRRFAPRYDFGRYTDGDLKSLLAWFEIYLPFPLPSGLTEGDCFAKIEHCTGGRINAVLPLVRHAGLAALVEGHDRILPEDVDAAHAQVLRLAGG